MDNHYRLGVYEKSMPDTVPLSDKLKMAAEAGYDFLELSIDESDEKLSRLDWEPSYLTELILDQRAAGVPIRSICLSGHRRFPLGHPNPDTREKSLTIMAKAIRLASALGVRLIQLAGYDVYYETSINSTQDYFLEGLQKSVQIAAREGVLLAFETMETEFMDTTEKALRWVMAISSPFLQIYPDAGNITNAAHLYGTSVYEDLMLGIGHIVALHLKETRPGVYREVPYGQGHVEFVKLLCVAASMGVNSFVGEFWCVPDTDWKKVLVENNTFLRAKINTAFLDTVQL